LGEAEQNQTGAFGVYIHWPFCLSKCPYCDFNSHVRHAAIDEARFARAFAAEIAATAARVGNRTVSSIFLGGGTPSLMAPKTVADVLDAVAQSWSIAPDVEIDLAAQVVESGRVWSCHAVGAAQELSLKIVERAYSAPAARAVAAELGMAG